jgi:hypothetical protein
MIRGSTKARSLYTLGLGLTQAWGYYLANPGHELLLQVCLVVLFK